MNVSWRTCNQPIRPTESKSIPVDRFLAPTGSDCSTGTGYRGQFMIWISELIASFFGRMTALNLLLHLALKSTLVLSIGLLITRLLMRKSSAAAKHLVWVLTFGVVALSPALARVLPFEPMLIGEREGKPAPTETVQPAEPDKLFEPGVRQRTSPSPIGSSPLVQQQQLPAKELGAFADELTREPNPIVITSPGPVTPVEVAAGNTKRESRESWVVGIQARTPVLFGIWIAGVTLCCSFLSLCRLELRQKQRRFTRVSNGRLIDALRILSSEAGIPTHRLSRCIGPAVDADDLGRSEAYHHVAVCREGLVRRPAADGTSP